MANGSEPPDTPNDQEPPEPQPTRKPPGPWGRRTEPQDYGKPPPRPEPPKKPQGPSDWLDGLSEMDPENEAQALFYLGWMAADVPRSVRAAARAEYQKKFGPLTSDEWKKWKEKGGSGSSVA